LQQANLALMCSVNIEQTLTVGAYPAKPAGTVLAVATFHT